MTPRQLALDAPTIDPFPTTLRDPIYCGFAYGPKDHAGAIAVDVVERFTRRKGYAPHEIQCHPSAVDVIAAEVGGIPVIGSGRALRVLLLGPLKG